MALNMVTDKKFDKALGWLSKRAKKTKSEIVRDLVINEYNSKLNGFRFGALAHLFPKGKKPTTAQILRDLKKIDEEAYDLD